MAEPVPIRRRPARLEARLEAARQRRFVGRDAYLDRFREAIASPEAPMSMLFVHGPGGVGKSTLLDAFERIARDQQVDTVRLDGRAMEPSPPSFLLALRDALGLPAHFFSCDQPAVPAGTAG